MALTPQWLDELRARVTLSGVIMRTTKLQRAGREWKACCPFHNEKSPSFTVNDEKGFYHCFGCGAHGDVIRWMTDQRGLEFMDAVKELAAQAGMEMPAPDPRAARQAEQRAGLHDVTAAAQDWFRRNLAGPEGRAAHDYLATRGFDAHTVERFGFGFALDNRTALKTALAQFGDAMLIEAGLLIVVEGKEPYDRFRDRLMLPIHDARGRVIGFGGRILASGKSDAPKYLNSPDTPLFDKGRTLYNLHRAGPASRQSHRVIVVEGYMDVIALAAAGIEDAVAPLGTALTEHQIELLWRLTDVPLLCFDGDAAGQRAAMRAATRALPLLKPGKSLAMVRLPAGLDPDDLVRRDGAAGLERLLAEPRSLVETLWAHERDALPLASPEEKAGLKARLLAHCEAIADRDIQALYRRELLDRYSAFAFPPRPPRPRGAPFRGSGHAAVHPALAPEAAARLRHAAGSGGRGALLTAVVAGLARYPDRIHRHAEALARLAPSDSRVAHALEALLDLADALENGGEAPINPKAELGERQDHAPYSFLQDGTDPSIAREQLDDAVNLLVERPAIEAAMAAATARFATDPEGAIAEQARLRERKLVLDRRLRQMASRQTGPLDRGDTSGAGQEQETD